MNIPDKLKVGGIFYSVRIMEPEDVSDKIGGQINTERCVIKVLKGDPQFMQETFLHELFHAINMEIEEEKIEFLAQAMMQVLVDNPKLFGGGEATHGKRKK